MIIGGSKIEVIQGIKRNLEENELNRKTEVNDPNLNEEEIAKCINDFYAVRENKVSFWFKSLKARIVTWGVGVSMSKDIQFEGLENIKDINDGAIVTSNHFNPLDNMTIRKLIKKRYHQTVNIVIQDTNLAMPGLLGELFNYTSNIPISKGPNYIKNTFMPYLKSKLDAGEYVLIYPEEEMWFNYRLPRPSKRGAFLFASQLNKPVISCFVEIRDTDKSDNEEFNKVKYIVHILKPIYKDPAKSDRENSMIMKDIDYKQKCEAYEKYYGKKIDYTFKCEDIAGLKKEYYEKF